MTCIVEGCNKPNRSNKCEYCNMHYTRLWRNGSLDRVNGETQPFIDSLQREGVGCVTWPFPRNAVTGYGKLTRDGVDILAHRYICEKFHGPPPTPEHTAAHSCGKGDEGCIAPWHLSWKTQADNLMDRVTHGTAPWLKEYDA